MYYTNHIVNIVHCVVNVRSVFYLRNIWNKLANY